MLIDSNKLFSLNRKNLTFNFFCMFKEKKHYLNHYYLFKKINK